MRLMINAPSILIYTKHVDFRNSINGLINVVTSNINVSLQDNIFIFYNKTRDKLKILAWHNNGYVLLLKRLEKGSFINSFDKDNSVVSMTQQQLSWLLAGLDWVQMSTWGELEYRDFS